MGPTEDTATPGLVFFLGVTVGAALPLAMLAFG
jgi:hypothetical protein